ncbi:MAG: RDD family protein [Archangiaceae bacterium]|nr:RDD family protein [Archangiaceae bacterium]
MTVDLSPAVLERRVLAGLIDGAVLMALCAAYFLVPVMTLGVVLPMWGVLAAVIGYAVIPLGAFKQTLGMRLLHLELVSREGHPVNYGDLLFRELLGRGWFPAAFIFNLAFSYLAMVLGYARFSMPVGLQAVFLLASALALVAVVCGHLLALGVKDRRTIADLMARSWVVPQQPVMPLDDADERAERAATRARTARNVVIAELLVFSAGLAMPWLMTRRTESTEQRAARLMRGRLEAQFKTNPESDAVSRQLGDAYDALGDAEAAQRVAREHQAALTRARDQRLTQQLAALDQNPGDEATLITVLGTLSEQNRLDEAKQRYAKFVAHNHDGGYRAGYAHWLSSNGFVEEGVSELEALVSDEPDFEGVHKFLARALVMAERLPEAQVEYQRELVRDPEDQDALEAMEELNAELGPLPKEKLAALKKEVKRAP